LVLEEHHSAVLELLTDDPVGLQTEPVAVELHCAVEVACAKCEDADSGLRDGIWGGQSAPRLENLWSKGTDAAAFAAVTPSGTA
jgi:hypothetical protein